MKSSGGRRLCACVGFVFAISAFSIVAGICYGETEKDPLPNIDVRYSNIMPDLPSAESAAESTRAYRTLSAVRAAVTEMRATSGDAEIGEHELFGVPKRISGNKVPLAKMGRGQSASDVVRGYLARNSAAFGITRCSMLDIKNAAE